LQIANVLVIGEMRNANVRDSVETGIAGVPDTGKWIFDSFFFYKIQAIDTDFKATTYKKVKI